MTKLILVATFIFLSFTAFSQAVVLKGTVLSGKEAIPYVNIGIKQKGIGTAATAEGKFTLQLAEAYLNDTLTFSAVGYQELSVPVKTIVEKNLSEFTLTEKTTSLREVVVTNRKPKIKKFGITFRNPFVHGTSQARDPNDISELAKLIKLNKKPSDILSVSLYLRSDKIASANMRINFYENANGDPGERMVEESIIKRLPLNKGWVTIDLEDYNITVDKDFFIAFEYLPDPRHKGEFMFTYGGDLGGSHHTRKASLGKWEKGIGAQLAAYVTVRQ
ncbi:carboxypeptidase-like regulatory domain-containing protein [Pontibacter sp. KCTC 32443]|uniref:carboxypeptidase-like regulatory domain-containing protein n=1 Tax=Pontibacter TaxID=323449 RepID=UPI00164D3655|nr:MULTISPECIES: carboxypeptidase-like regulatory domain-containing protein [Pontibacter]MBC5775199.1 carboxypeptidase-like regulatory domain-containing protein [Pontibacter sp. KCTC 32443]